MGMADATPSLSIPGAGHQFADLSAIHSYVHQGDIYNNPGSTTGHHEQDEIQEYGLCLNLAPAIDPTHFVGRVEEIETMTQILCPGQPSTEQRRLVLGGMGGVGKTQLALAYTRQHRTQYASVFWLNATSVSSLTASFRSLAGRVLHRQDVKTLDDEKTLALALAWLADTRNTRWLLIFDNHDEPDEFDIERYCPYAGHGSVLITTRRPDLVTGQPVRVQPLKKMEDSMHILQTRSGRMDVIDDPHARLLVERLHGLPLALATAGAYLRRSTYTFQQYLQAYDQRWQVDHRRPLRLHDYPNRTLYTTWNLSYCRLEAEDPDAARLLKLLAYFDNHEIWYELLHAGLSAHSSTWLRLLLADQETFESMMRTLIDYCLVDIQHVTRSYSIHTCVHDWILGELNRELDSQSYWYAFDCVAASIDGKDWGKLAQVKYARLSQHGVRLTHHRFEACDERGYNLSKRLHKATWIAKMLQDQVQRSASEHIYKRALAGQEKVVGLDHTATLNTANLLGNLYMTDDKLELAEQMYRRALAGFEKALGPDHSLTLMIVHNLGSLHRSQGELDKAEHMYQRALAGCERELGPDHSSTLETVDELGTLYRRQGKLDQAEQMYQRALSAGVKARGPDHSLTLRTVQNLGVLYRYQGKMDEAEQMYQRALSGREKTLGPDHISVLVTVDGLGTLYRYQGKLDEAEQMYHRALAGYEKILGRDHISVTQTVENLGVLYSTLGKLKQAEKLFERSAKIHSDCLHREKSTIQHVRDYSESLRRCIWAHGTRWSWQLSKLVSLIKQWDYDPYLVQVLGRVLINWDDELNATKAYHYAVRYVDRKRSDYHGTFCNSCLRHIVVGMGLHVCKVCIETDLCDQCMSGYHNSKTRLPTCSGHPFFQVKRPTVTNDGVTSANAVEMDTWMDSLLSTYATNGTME